MGGASGRPSGLRTLDPSGTRTRKSWLPTPNPAGSPQSLVLAIAAASAPWGTAKRVPVGVREKSPFFARPLPPRGVTLGSHAPARVSRWPCPSTPASLNPATRSPRPLRPSHCPAPADKAPDTPTERSPPLDPGPPARSRACPRRGRGPVPRHPGRVLGECAQPGGTSGPRAGAQAGGDRPGLGGSGAHHPGAATAAAAAAAAGGSGTGQWGWPDKGPPRLPPQAGPPPPPPPPLARPQCPPSQAFAPLPFPCSSLPECPSLPPTPAPSPALSTRAAPPPSPPRPRPAPPRPHLPWARPAPPLNPPGLAPPLSSPSSKIN